MATAPKPSAPSASDLLMVSLSKFYSVRANMQRVLPYVACTSDVSLRLVDWFVTNYAKKHNTVIVRGGEKGVTHVNVYLSYRTQLKAYSKQQFDHFRRRDRIMFYYERDRAIETTVGQLNFFRWALQNDVLEHISAHAAAIEQDMFAAQKGGEAPAAAASPPSSPPAAAPRPARGRPPKSVAAAKAAAAAAAAQAQGEGEGEGEGEDAAAKRKRRTQTVAACKASVAMTRMVGQRTVVFD